MQRKCSTQNPPANGKTLSTAGFQIVLYKLDSSSSTVGKSEALYAEEKVSQIMATVKLFWLLTLHDWKCSCKLVLEAQHWEQKGLDWVFATGTEK